MKTIGIIPARMAATRFPNKPMTLIKGIPMIGHVYLRSKRATLLDEVYVATCDQEIVAYIELIGGKAVMTSDRHKRASDRAEEALRIIENAGGEKIDYVFMIQGDEPLVDPRMLDQAVKSVYESDGLEFFNLMTRITDESEFKDVNAVKVVVDKEFHALYLSRVPIPHQKSFSQGIDLYKQTGLMIYSNQLLKRFSSWEETPLEIIESVDVLRLLENGCKLKMQATESRLLGVDIPGDVPRVEKLLTEDPLFKDYSSSYLRS